MRKIGLYSFRVVLAVAVEQSGQVTKAVVSLDAVSALPTKMLCRSPHCLVMIAAFTVSLVP